MCSIKFMCLCDDVHVYMLPIELQSLKCNNNLTTRFMNHVRLSPRPDKMLTK